MVPIVCSSQNKLKGIKGQKPVILVIKKKELSVYSWTQQLEELILKLCKPKGKKTCPISLHDINKLVSKLNLKLLFLTNK